MRHCSHESKRCAHNLLGGNYQYQSYGANTPTCCKEKLCQLLAELHEVFTRSNINYACLYGTHLGQVRHGGLIPWDTDIDVGVPLEQRTKVAALIQKNFRSHYIVEESWGYRINYSETNLLHIDIEFWYLDKNQRVFDNDIYVGTRKLPDDIFSDTSEKPFNGIHAIFPNNNQILQMIYGHDFMRKGVRKWCKISSNKHVDLYD